MNYFEWFGIPVAFHIDEGELRRVFLRKSKQFHPDFHTEASEAEQAVVLEKSSMNNEAYKALSDPDARLRHILDIGGAMLNDPQQNETLPQDFLMEMMELNEQIMELSFEPDATRYHQISEQVQAFEDQLFTDAKPALEQYQAQPEQRDILLTLKNFYLKKKYLLRIRENLLTFAPA
jgi:molecular chaperone HscB